MKLSDIIPQTDIDGALQDDDEIIQYKLLVAKQAVAYAQSIAPHDEGDYANGIRIGRFGNKGVIIEFSDYKSHWIEFGSVHNPESSVRARTENQFTEKR
ncbi:hypothetical protein MHPYR_180056 [uncultured Mycobacterium sp.]|uniref:Phage protein n=1 Tax=uncultured Mycobacterium sp. TaxID=171292 RepID=A0A1Y5P4Y4_9MYCO|nr:hypothetical protein MHPYR_180056 [uncultured Mycobacterium sp.]